MSWVGIVLGIVVGIPFPIIGLWVLYRIAAAVLSGGSYDDRVRSKDCDKTSMDDGCVTCAPYTVVGGRAHCSKQHE